MKKEPSNIVMPILNLTTIKSSHSSSILSYHSPDRKLSFNFHKSKSFNHIQNQPIHDRTPTKKEEDPKSQSDKTFTSLVNPFDNAILDYLSLFKPHLIAVKAMETQITMLVNSKKIIVANRNPSKKVLVFDIDETLVYNLASEYESVDAGILIRPYCKSVLLILSEYYDIWVWTAAVKEVGEMAVRMIDPEGKIIKNAFFRELCIPLLENVYLKDLRVFANLELSDVAIIENQLMSFATNIDNGFLIDSYVGNEEDQELLLVQEFFCTSLKYKDIREPLATAFRMRESLKYIFA